MKDLKGNEVDVQADIVAINQAQELALQREHMQKVLLHPSLTDRERALIRCNSGTRIRDMSPDELKDFGIDLYSLIYLNRGFPPLEAEMLADRGKLLAIDLGTYHSTAFKDDFYEAVRMGSLDFFGKLYYEHKEDYDAFNRPKILEWYSKFCFDHEERKRALEKKRSIEAAIRRIDKPITEEEKELSAQEYYDFLLSEWKRTGVVNDLGNTCYRWLWKKKKITCTEKHWSELLVQAEATVLGDLQGERSKAAQSGMVGDVRRITEAIEQINDDRIKIEARNLMLEEYFKSLQQ